MKKCSGCKKLKPRGEFTVRSNQADGLDYYCRDCKHARTVRSLQKPENIAANRARARRWRELNPEKAKATHDAWIARNKERASRSAKFRQLRHRYGLSKGEYETLMRESGGKCMLCGSDTRLCVDHCHESNVVRGILCLRCNTAIERIEKIPEFSLKAAEYLKKHAEE